MATVNAKNKAEELAAVMEWCRAILIFFTESSGPSEVCSLLESAVAETFEKGDLRGMRQIAREFVKLAGAFTENDWDKLDGVLREKLGKGLREGAKLETDKVDKVLKRGKIGSKAEYRLLSERADAIGTEESKRDELERINTLLIAYLDRHKRSPI